MSEEEIEIVARLMKIELDDRSEHVERVQKMLAYFDILDRARVEDEQVTHREMSIDQLREDAHLQYPDRLIDLMRSRKGAYVRAPKMA